MIRCQTSIFYRNASWQVKFDPAIQYPSIIEEMDHWCQENCKSWWLGLTSKYLFDKHDDAILFYLTWSPDV